MAFTALNSAVVDLRNALRIFAGEKALSEITVRPPSQDDDEASFLRLVSWSYVLLFEAGRVAIPYLIKLPASSGVPDGGPDVARSLVHDLRAWSFHNLGLASDRGVAMSKRVQLWFIGTCEQFPPNESVAWQMCFLKLCTEVESIVGHCQKAMTNVLAAEDDGDAATADLRRRIDRAWEAVEFHMLVGDAGVRLGIGVDAVAFSQRRLSKWREYLECLPGSEDLKGHMVRMIERDLLDHAAEVLPIGGRDVMDALGLEAGPEVGKALHQARLLFRAGVRDPVTILERLKDSPSGWVS